MNRTFLDLLNLAQQAEPIAPPNGAALASGKPISLVIHAPDDPGVLARGNLDAYRAMGRDLVFWREEWWQWKGRNWIAMPRSDFEAKLTKSIEKQLDEAWLEERKKRAEDAPFKPRRRITRALIGDTEKAHRALCNIDGDRDQPTWRDDPSRHIDFLCFANGILDLRELTAGNDDCFRPHDANWFSSQILPYEFDPAAKCPLWKQFLHDVWDGDEDAISTLQMLFGYLLTPDTSLEKMFLIIGPKRSGKGTMVTVLESILGTAATTSTTFSEMAGQFGLWYLVGKNLATISDARISGRTDIGPVIEHLLRISGQDAITVNRKNRDQVTTRISARILITTNETPRLTDASGAIASRLIVWQMAKSYYGREDHGLKKRLLGELPGILNWAIAGWHRLKEAGRIPEPKCGREAAEDLLELSSPITSFVAQKCDLDPGAEIEVDAIFHAWKSYAEDNGLGRLMASKSALSQKLKAAFPQIRTTRPRTNERSRARKFSGITLKNIYEHENFSIYDGDENQKSAF
jgi:putative DNA primase/helicase